MRNTILAAALLGLSSGYASAQAPRDWNAPFPAHRVIDNVYFVGTEALGTFLITTPNGHFLINSDFETTVPLIRASVESLGFKFEDIEIILGSHAHGDHMEADALVKELTGADVMVMQEDVEGLRALRPHGKEHPIDRILHDGEEVALGGTTLIAHRTPGHTKGCTSWCLVAEEAGKAYDVLIACSFGANDNYVLVNNPDYPQIAEDYAAMYAKARTLPVDVFLGSHGFFYDLAGKYEKLLHRQPGDANPFVDRAGYLSHIATQEQRFRAMLQTQQAAAR
nr:SubclassB3_beta_lactamase [uncultured bacterium]